MIGFVTLHGCRSIGADNTVCLAFLLASLGIFACVYIAGLVVDLTFDSGMFARILLISAYSLRYLIALPKEIKSMELGAARLEKLIDETF